MTSSESACMVAPAGLGDCGLGCIFGSMYLAQIAVTLASRFLRACTVRLPKAVSRCWGSSHVCIPECTCCQILLQEWRIPAQRCALMTIPHQT